MANFLDVLLDHARSDVPSRLKEDFGRGLDRVGDGFEEYVGEDNAKRLAYGGKLIGQFADTFDPANVAYETIYKPGLDVLGELGAKYDRAAGVADDSSSEASFSPEAEKGDPQTKEELISALLSASRGAGRIVSSKDALNEARNGVLTLGPNDTVVTPSGKRGFSRSNKSIGQALQEKEASKKLFEDRQNAILSGVLNSNTLMSNPAAIPLVLQTLGYNPVESDSSEIEPEIGSEGDGEEDGVGLTEFALLIGAGALLGSKRGRAAVKNLFGKFKRSGGKVGNEIAEDAKTLQPEYKNFGKTGSFVEGPMPKDNYASKAERIAEFRKGQKARAKLAEAERRFAENLPALRESGDVIALSPNEKAIRDMLAGPGNTRAKRMADIAPETGFTLGDAVSMGASNKQRINDFETEKLRKLFVPALTGSAPPSTVNVNALKEALRQSGAPLPPVERLESSWGGLGSELELLKRLLKGRE